MNYSDAGRVSAIMEENGYVKTALESEADVVIFLACAVRESAVNRLYGNGKKFKKYRKNNPGFRSVLTGCTVKKDLEKLGRLFDIIIDIQNIKDLPTKLENSDTNYNLDYDYFKIKPSYDKPYSAYVPIMTGCNNFCSYCIVPYTRGREYSRPLEDIIKEIKELVQKGCKEIVLLGQNVNSYRPDNRTDFPALLEKVDMIEGDFWIRFLTSHPKDMSERLILTIKNSSKCTNFIHLALQSGSDEILQKMNRKYTKEHFIVLVNDIRKNIKDVTLTTDIIIGFPGETENDFEETAKIMRKASFDLAYINRYSPRAGTVSYSMQDDVTPEIKKKRETFLNDILRDTALENNIKYIGRTVDVLIEKDEGNSLFGKTRSFKDIKIKKTDSGKVHNLVGTFIKVKVVKATPWALEGELS
jgi:tRNA-2-methylthio-N6-dimethylallyladenosine synthase